MTTPGPRPLAPRHLWLAGAGIATMLGLLSFTYQYLDVFVRGRSEPFHEKLVEELTGAWGACLAVPVVMLTRRVAGRGLRAILPQLGGLLAYSGIHTLWNWGTRVLAYAAFGLGEYDIVSNPRLTTSNSQLSLP